MRWSVSRLRDKYVETGDLGKGDFGEKQHGSLNHSLCSYLTVVNYATERPQMIHEFIVVVPVEMHTG